MSTTNQQVAHIWAQGAARRAQGSNFSCASNVLYSYGTCVGVIRDGVAFLSSDNMTPTTAKQLSYARSAARHRVVLMTPAFTYGVMSDPSAAQCIIAAAESMPGEFQKLCRAKSNQEYLITWYNERRELILQLAEQFQVADLPAMPEVTGDLKEQAKEHARAARQRKAEAEQRAEERERAQRIIDQGELDTWLQTGHGRYPHSFYQYGQDQLTIRDGVVVTSRGAEAPLEHVRKAVGFYLERERRKCPKCDALNRVKYDECACGTELPGPVQDAVKFVEWHKNGHRVPLGHFELDSIDEQGNVKAGCHTFTAAEIARFIEQWKELLS